MDHNFLQQKYVLNTYVNRQLTLVRGQGVFLYGEDGGRYLDLMGNYGVNIFGHSHPKITKVIAAQHETYNEALARVERAELPCRLRVIRPEVKLPISRLTANRERILRALQQGYKDALLQLDLTHPLKDDKLL